MYVHINILQCNVVPSSSSNPELMPLDWLNNRESKSPSPDAPCDALAGSPRAICSLMSRSLLRSSLERLSGAALSKLRIRERSLWRSWRSSSLSRSSSLPAPALLLGKRRPARSSLAFWASSRSLLSFASFSLAANFFSSWARASTDSRAFLSAM